MKRKSSVSLGPGASSLILIFVVLSLSVLGILSLMTARNDRILSERMADVMEAVYTLSESAEETRMEAGILLSACAEDADGEEDYLSRIMERIPEDWELDDRVLSWKETDGTRTLDCAVEVLPLPGPERTRWIRHNLTSEIAGEEDDDSWNW